MTDTETIESLRLKLSKAEGTLARVREKCEGPITHQASGAVRFGIGVAYREVLALLSQEDQ